MKIEVVICPRTDRLKEIGEVLKGTRIKLGAQDIQLPNQPVESTNRLSK